MTKRERLPMSPVVRRCAPPTPLLRYIAFVPCCHLAPGSYQVAYGGSISVLAGVAMFELKRGSVAIGSAAASALLLGYFVTRLRQGRVRFAAANLKVTVTAGCSCQANMCPW